MNLKTKNLDIKNINFKNIKFFDFFKNKYDYDITKVIGVKNKERYILYTDRKLLRIYRDNLKSSALLSSYIPIEDAIFYNFVVEANVLEKIDINTFIETKVYEEAGLLETEKYIIKYKIVDRLLDEKEVMIQTVIVPETYINKSYNYILEETGYIDYISFPAFAYKTLYDEEVLKKADDVFVIILYDKIFLTFYSEGELLYINTISGGLNKIYEVLKELKIKKFDKELFKKLLTKKGFSKSKYTKKEEIIYRAISGEFENRINLINEQILSVIENYDIDKVDRIFITSEYGSIPGINQYIKDSLNIRSFGFDFYEKYNLDRLAVDPFLFLAMLECAHAYKSGDLEFNYSLFLRKPKFIFRTSGILIISAAASTALFSLYPLYLYLQGVNFEKKSKTVKTKLNKIISQKNIVNAQISRYDKKEKSLQKEIAQNKKIINNYKKFIKDIYKFKFSYIPKSQEIVDLTLIMNKFDIFLKHMSYKDGTYLIDIYSYNDDKLAKFIHALANNGFNVYFDTIMKDDKTNRYTTTIRIEE